MTTELSVPNALGHVFSPLDMETFALQLKRHLHCAKSTADVRLFATMPKTERRTHETPFFSKSISLNDGHISMTSCVLVSKSIAKEHMVSLIVTVIDASYFDVPYGQQVEKHDNANFLCRSEKHLG